MNRPFDYIFKRFFSRGAMRFYERTIGEKIASMRVMEEASLQVKVVFGAADLIVELVTVSGRRIILHLEFQKAYDRGLGKRMVKYCIAIEEEYGLYPMQIVFCVADFAEMYAGGTALGNPGEKTNLHIFFQAINVSQLRPEWFLDEGQVLSVAVGLFCRVDAQAEEILLQTYERAIAARAATIDELGDFVLALQLSLSINRINKRIYHKFMDATKQLYDVSDLVKDLIYSHPEFYHPFKSELDAQLRANFDDIKKAGFDDGRKAGFDDGRKAGFDDGRKAGFDDGRKAGFDEWKRETAMKLYRMGLSPESIFEATGLRPQDYLGS